jgi:hypothetical protein
MAYLAGGIAAGFMNAIVFTRATKTSTPSGGRLYRPEIFFGKSGVKRDFTYRERPAMPA